MLAKNLEVRETMKAKRVRQWEVAEILHITERTMSVWMRRELSPERREAVMKAIDTVEQEHEKEV